MADRVPCFLGAAHILGRSYSSLRRILMGPTSSGLKSCQWQLGKALPVSTSEFKEIIPDASEVSSSLSQEGLTSLMQDG